MAKRRGPLVRPLDGWSLARAADGLSAVISGAATLALEQWLDLLVAWNARVDLTAARSSDELVDLMLADALVLASRIPQNARVIDVGTGAGGPGLALSVLRPDLTVTLVEPLGKRAAFLRTVLGTLALPNVTVHAQRGEDAAVAHPHAWDVALARATLAPAPWLALAEELVGRAGAAWVFLAKEPNPTHAGFVVDEEVAYAWPLTGAARRLVRYERTAS